jgi:hypothetical protein
MTTKKEFKLNVVSNSQPLSQDAFAEYIKTNVWDTYWEEKHSFIGTVTAYLESLGYSRQHHYLPEGVFRTLQNVYDVMVINVPATTEPLTVKELFLEPDNLSPEFWVRGLPEGEYAIPTEKLTELVSKTRAIYQLNPRHYYFEIVKGRVWLKYQHIIGSRFICTIKESDSVQG